MRIQRKLGLAAFLAVMLSLVMASVAIAAAPISKSGSPDPDVPVEIDANINDQPLLFAVTDVAIDPDGDPLELAGASYPCQYDDSTHFKVVIEPWDVVEDQKTCNVLIKDDEGSDDDPGNDNYVSVYVKITLTEGDTESPVVTITSPADGTTFTTNTATLTYGATDNSGVAPTCDVANNSNVSLNVGSNTFTVNCTDAAGNTGSDSVTVTYEVPVVENCTVRISLDNIQRPEGDENHQIHVPITLSNPCATTVTLRYSTQAKTADGSDYEEATNQSITIPAGVTTASIPITIIGDSTRESSEIFFVLAFSDVQGVTFGKDKATVVIQNDDTAK